MRNGLIKITYSGASEVINAIFTQTMERLPHAPDGGIRYHPQFRANSDGVTARLTIELPPALLDALSGLNFELITASESVAQLDEVTGKKYHVTSKPKPD